MKAKQANSVIYAGDRVKVPPPSSALLSSLLMSKGDCAQVPPEQPPPSVTVLSPLITRLIVISELVKTLSPFWVFTAKR